MRSGKVFWHRGAVSFQSHIRSGQVEAGRDGWAGVGILLMVLDLGFDSR